MAAAFRGVFAPLAQDDPLAQGVPTFASAAEALKWMTALSQRPSNPAFPGLCHSISTLVGRKQVFEELMPRIKQEAILHASPRRMPSPDELARNRFWNTPVHQGLADRMAAPHHAGLSSESTHNTLVYAFDHMRCGVLVQIRNREVVTFAPFVNDQYRNNWAKNLATEPSPLSAYYAEKRHHYREEKIIEPEAWWANGNIICNEHETGGGNTQWWGDNLLLPFKHMLEQLCKRRNVPDVDFFFNKRDHPQLRASLCEPYDFLFDQHNYPLPQEVRFPVYTPFVSFYCASLFSDLPCPTNEDWKGCTGLIFPETSIPPLKEPSDLFAPAKFAQFKEDFDNKQDTAFFRGNATGGGTTPANNQRLALSKLGHLWSQNEDTKTLLDAGVTGYNLRDKKLFGEPMRFARKEELPPLVDPVPMYKQSKYKYLIYVEGHCAANRYSFLMRLGSVILKVESKCEARDLWFFPMLKPADTLHDAVDLPLEADHVPVKSDLSDLRHAIEWCRRNNDACKAIAANALRFHEKFLSEEAVLDYWQLILASIGSKTLYPPSWYSSPAGYKPPNPPAVRGHGYCWRPSPNESVWCKRCRETVEAEAAAAAAAAAAANAAAVGAMGGGYGAVKAGEQQKVATAQVQSIANMCRRCRKDKATACTCGNA